VFFKSFLSEIISRYPFSSKNSAVWNSFGNVSLIVLSMTLFPANPINALGSAIVISAKDAKDAETPPVVGSVSTAIYNPFSLNLAKA
jgi:hypothetical protein